MAGHPPGREPSVRASQLLLTTRRDAPADASSASHALLVGELLVASDRGRCPYHITTHAAEHVRKPRARAKPVGEHPVEIDAVAVAERLEQRVEELQVGLPCTGRPAGVEAVGADDDRVVSRRVLDI
jgi:hypothetical protein